MNASDRVSPPTPYINDKIVRDPHQLYGRSELLAYIYAIIAASGSISIVGPPRIGKGSLLYCLRFEELWRLYAAAYVEQLRNKIFVFADMRSLVLKNWDSFFRSLNKEIIRQSKEIINLEHMPISGTEGFSAILDELADQNYELVLALDSFEKLRENKQLSYELTAFLRSEGARVSYVVASTIPLTEIFPEEPLSSPFYNLFSCRERIGILASSDARAFVKTPAQEAGVPFTDAEVDWILEQAGGHPFFLRFLCHMLFRRKESRPMEAVDFEKMSKIAYNELSPHFSAIWHGLEKQEQEEFLHASQTAGAEPFYGSKLFQRFVNEHAHEKMGLDIDDVKYALKNQSKPAVLGKSRLRQLKLIKPYLDEHPHASAAEVGGVIRAMLSQVLERLKGQGYRRDGDPGWETYNILYYCYFHNPHIIIEQIGARLGLGERTVYRKKDEALASFFLALHDMEREAHS